MNKKSIKVGNFSNLKIQAKTKQENDKENLTLPFLVCISEGLMTQDSLLFPLFSSWGATDFLLPRMHKDDEHLVCYFVLMT